MSKHIFSKLLSAVFVLAVLSSSVAAGQTWIGSLSVVTTDTTATITWTTAVPSDTQVKYGTTASYGRRSPLASSLVTTHIVTLTSLTANTSYHFRPLNDDLSGVLVTGLDNTFQTKAGPISVSVSPSTATVTSGSTQQFTVQVKNASNTAVTWSTTAGTISSSGLFTAPSVTSDTTVTITATSAADTTKKGTASVTVQAASASLSLNPKSLSFSAQQGAANPQAANVSITNAGGGTLNFTTSTDAAWLTATPPSGTVPATLQVGPSVTGLAVGTYTGHVVVSAAGATGSPATITVTLVVTAPPVSHAVTLNWNASTSSEVVGYNAYRSTISGGPYSLIASAIGGLTYSDLSVQSGVTYYYVVTATDDHGQESVNSNEAKASVP